MGIGMLKPSTLIQFHNFFREINFKARYKTLFHDFIPNFNFKAGYVTL